MPQEKEIITVADKRIIDTEELKTTINTMIDRVVSLKNYLAGVKEQITDGDITVPPDQEAEKTRLVARLPAFNAVLQAIVAQGF